jgi:hypothetical protein
VSATVGVVAREVRPLKFRGEAPRYRLVGAFFLLMPPHLKVKAPFCNYDVIISLAEVRAAAVVARGADGAAPGVWVKLKFGLGRQESAGWDECRM